MMNKCDSSELDLFTVLREKHILHHACKCDRYIGDDDDDDDDDVDDDDNDDK